MFNIMPSTVKVAHLFMSSILKEGNRVVDATVGNGHDTLFLAEGVGPHGRVYGFDIQSEAITNTRQRLEESGYLERVELFQTGHENMKEIIHGPVEGVMFNLGYLPGGDHNLITNPETTLKGLVAALGLIKPGGLITLVVYPGHLGGKDEANRLEHFISALPKAHYSVTKTSYENRTPATPYLIAIEKSEMLK